jgi:hypothetical protein
MPPLEMSPESSPFKTLMEYMTPVIQPIVTALRFIGALAWSNHREIEQIRLEQLEESNLRTLQHYDTMLELSMLRREVADLKGLMLILIALIVLVLIIVAIPHVRYVP